MPTTLSLIIRTLLLSLLMVVIQFEPLHSAFIWLSNAFQTHELWRIVTGHFVHTNFIHLAMNLSALSLIIWIFLQTIKETYFIQLIFILSITIGLGLFGTQLRSYQGFSGVLHGLFAFYALVELKQKKKLSSILYLGLWLKIITEQTIGPASQTQALIQTQVAIQAHLQGAIFGSLLALIYSLKMKKGITN